MDADTLARLEPAVNRSECPACGALRHQRCRNLAFPSISRRLILSAEAARNRASKDPRARGHPAARGSGPANAMTTANAKEAS